MSENAMLPLPEQISTPITIEELALLTGGKATTADLKRLIPSDYQEVFSDDSEENERHLWVHNMTFNAIEPEISVTPTADDACYIYWAPKYDELYFGFTQPLFQQKMQEAAKMHFSDVIEEGSKKYRELNAGDKLFRLYFSDPEAEVVLTAFYIELTDFIDPIVLLKNRIKCPSDKLPQLDLPSSVNVPISFDEMLHIAMRMPNLDEWAKINVPMAEVHRKLDDIGTNHVEELAFAKNMKIVELFDNRWAADGEDGFYLYYEQRLGRYTYHFGFNDQDFKRIYETAKENGFANEQSAGTITYVDGTEAKEKFISKKADGILSLMHYIDHQNGTVDVFFEFVYLPQ